MYIIRTTDTRSWDESYPSQAAALADLAVSYGWDAPVTSECDADGGMAVSVYESQAECDADGDGAYAPRIIEVAE